MGRKKHERNSRLSDKAQWFIGAKKSKLFKCKKIYVIPASVWLEPLSNLKTSVSVTKIVSVYKSDGY